jgi:hypothetical protein
VTRKKKEWVLLEESKFLHANIYRFADHMKNDKCQQCIAWFWQTDKRLIIYRANYFGVFARLARKAFHFLGSCLRTSGETASTGKISSGTSIS